MASPSSTAAPRTAQMESLPPLPTAHGSRSWYSLPVEEVAAALSTDPERGLTQEEAARRLAIFGPNVIREVDRAPWWRILARQFTSALIVILVIAAAIAAAIGELGDAVTILAIVILNGALGFIQEWRAEQAIAALKAMLSPKATALRNGAHAVLPAQDLVPGDVVTVEAGDQVPADLRLFETVDFRLDEAVLTGESIPVAKSVEPVPAGTPLPGQRCVAFMGTTAVNGSARGIVTATGMDTEIGRIAALTQSVEEEVTPLARQLRVLGRQLGIAALFLAALVAVVGWLSGKNLAEMFLTGVSLAVAIVPEGLPAVVTVTLALGVRAMARRRALLRHLQAAETLGAATVICTDKTGTLTRNEMTVARIWLPAGAVEISGTGYVPEGQFRSADTLFDPHTRPDLMALLETAATCNHAELREDHGNWSIIGEPTEAALAVAARKAGIVRDPSRIHGEISFDSIRKRMTVFAASSRGRVVAHVKGAPEEMLARSTRLLDSGAVRPMTSEDRANIVAAYSQMAENGLRTLAFARRELPPGAPETPDDVEQELVFLGLAGLIDMPRKEVPAALKLARSAGIKVIMVTGDAGLTAMSIARQVGMSPPGFLTGSELDRLNDRALAEAIERGCVFARVSPEHKIRIVELLHAQGETVAMTGDGVNDAPALKRADVGVAMGKRGTDVARGAADMVLADDNFASIIGAIEEGRRQYDNIKKFVRYLLSSNYSEVAAILVNVLIGGPLILAPVQILWMNLVTDGPTALSLGVEPPEKGIMQRPPRRRDEGVIGRPGLIQILLLGTYMGGAALFLFYYYSPTASAHAAALAQTAAFTGLIVMEKLNVFNFRTLTAPVLSSGLFSNPWVWLAVAGAIGLQVAAVHVPFLQDALHTVPLGLADWALIFAIAAPVPIIPEIIKLLTWRAQE